MNYIFIMKPDKHLSPNPFLSVLCIVFTKFNKVKVIVRK